MMREIFIALLAGRLQEGRISRLQTMKRAGAFLLPAAEAAIYRRKLFEKIGLFDEAHFAYLEDIDLGYRANIYGYKNVFAPKAEVLHAGSAVSGSRHNAFKVSLSSRNSIYLIYKNMPVLQVLLNLPFLLVGFLIKTLFFVKKGLGREYIKGLKKGLNFLFQRKDETRRYVLKRDIFLPISGYSWNYYFLSCTFCNNIVKCSKEGN